MYAIANEKLLFFDVPKSRTSISQNYHIRKSDNLIKDKKQVSFFWFITVTVSKGVYEYLLANSCLNLPCVLVSCFQSDFLRIQEFVN